MRLVVAISGASGVNLGIKFLNLLPKDIEAFVVISESAKIALKYENSSAFDNLTNQKNITIFKNSDIAAPIASGSFKIDKMAIIPCSMNTLAKCTYGLADNLITRAFAVSLKEKREVLIAPREMPFSQIPLENMTKLSSMGVTISPPILGYYSNNSTIDEMENFIIGKWYDSLKIENNLYKRWKSDE